MTDNPTTSADPQAQAPAMPAPDPALRRFDRFIGTWEMRGRTHGSEVDDVVGTASYAWLPGGFFLEQRTKIEFTGFAVEAVEIIRYDPETGTFPSTVYPSMFGSPLPYRWKLDGDDVTITAETLHATFHGRWSEDGATFSGGWRPDPGHENDPGNIAYDVWGGRAQS
ncbi:MAG TPA: DUF1579 family protein [Pilimelia sp.]|nr:DUF1579 family protein [Pilimelia sp.]